MIRSDGFGRWISKPCSKRALRSWEWPTRSQSRIAPAAAQVYGAIKDQRLTHDGNPILAAHVGHCIAKGTRWGLLPTKDSPDSPRHIDLAIAAIIAYDMAVRQTSGTGTSPASTWRAYDLCGCLQSCGHVLDKAYEQKERGPDGPAGPWTVSDKPLTPQGRVPVLCPSCGALRQWRQPATAEDIEKFEAKTKRAARAVELTKAPNIDGMFKVPMKSAPLRK